MLTFILVFIVHIILYLLGHSFAGADSGCGMLVGCADCVTVTVTVFVDVTTKAGSTWRKILYRTYIGNILRRKLLHNYMN